MNSSVYLTIGRSMWAVICLLILVVPHSWAQTDQENFATEIVPANADSPAGEASATELPSTDASDSADSVSQSDNEEKLKTGKSEVEYNEDNYRRFMELKDQDRRGITLPTNAYQPGKQKLDELPEESQKHLRNELRSVIVQEGEWQEGDENKQYAYVPSAAAESDAELQKLEAEAWNELVDKYQEREAQIYSNSVRSEAAKQAAAGGHPGQTGQQGRNGSAGQQGQAGQEGSQDGQSVQSGQSGTQNRQQSQSDAGSPSSKGSYSPAEAANMQEATRNQGVSENALQFLMQSQQGESEDAAAQEKQLSEAAQTAQNADRDMKTETVNVTASALDSRKSQEPDEQRQGLDQKKETGTTQNAFEQLRGNSQQQDSPPDTILLRDLINVKGIIEEVPAQQPDKGEQPRGNER